MVYVNAYYVSIGTNNINYNVICNKKSDALSLLDT
jgi:hypothetical protein